jgi:hypothetical protein
MQFVIQRKCESPGLPIRQDGKKHGSILIENGAEKMKLLRPSWHVAGLFFATYARGIIRDCSCHPWSFFPQTFSFQGFLKPAYA